MACADACVCAAMADCERRATLWWRRCWARTNSPSARRCWLRWAATWRASATSIPVPPALRRRSRSCGRSSAASRSIWCGSLRASQARFGRMLAELGLPSLDAAIGRTDLLEQTRFDGCLDLTPMFAAPPDGGKAGARRWQGKRNLRPEDHAPIDDAWVEPAVAAYKAGEPFLVDSLIANEDRTFGARLAGELAMLQSAGIKAAGSADLPAHWRSGAVVRRLCGAGHGADPQRPGQRFRRQESFRRRDYSPRAGSRGAAVGAAHDPRQRRTLRSDQRCAVCRRTRRRAVCRSELRSVWRWWKASATMAAST